MFTRAIFLTLMVTLITTSAWAATATFNVNATVRQVIAITWVSDLNFDVLDIGATDTTYTVNAAAAAGAGAGPAATSGAFTVTGDNGSTATIAVTTPVTATVGATTLSFGLTTSASTVTFGAGASSIYVGGSVLVPTTADAGSYATTSTLTILYQ